MSSARLIGGVLTAVILAGSGAYGYQGWQESRPTVTNLDKVVRSIWADSMQSKGHIYRSAHSEVCLPVPMDTPPDSKSTTLRNMAWHIDFLDEASATPARQKHLARLDALVAANLLVSQSEIVTTPVGPKTARRYRISDAGWVANSFNSGQDLPCFIFANASYLGITLVEKLNPSAPYVENDNAYQVTGRVGVSSPADLQPWARDSAIMNTFPEIQHAMSGKDYVAVVAHIRGEWVDFSEILKNRRYPERAASIVPSPPKKEIEMAFESMRKLPAPTREELSRLLEVMHGSGKLGVWPGYCVPLPGSEKLPVDQKMDSTPTMPYRVAVANNIDRQPNDPIGKRTQPYLNSLLQLGILTKVPDGAPGTYLGTDFYELAPAYVESLSQRYGPCLVMGPPQVKVVYLQIFEQDAYGMPETSFQYKLRLGYPNHPKWMDDPVLLSQWSELRGMVERGIACDGKFNFDRVKRESFGGGGSCRPAFESVTDVQ